jgi:hypothetical protein
VEGLRRRLPEELPGVGRRLPSPSLFAYVYYVNMKAALDGLAAVNGDLSGGGHAKYREALSKMTLKTPPATCGWTATGRPSAPPSSPKW